MTMGPVSKDTFDGLVSFGRTSKLGEESLTLAEKRKQLENARKHEVSKSHSAYGDPSAWDAFGPGPSSTLANVRPVQLNQAEQRLLETVVANASVEGHVMNKNHAIVSESPEKSHKEHSESTAAKDRAIAEIIEMGFSPEQARNALLHTKTGVDVQSAVLFLLEDAHRRSKAQESVPHLPDKASSSPERRSVTKGGFSPAASEMSQNLLRQANLLWLQGKKKVNKAIGEIQKDEKSSLPRWMRENGSYNGPDTASGLLTNEARALEIDSRPSSVGTNQPLSEAVCVSAKSTSKNVSDSATNTSEPNPSIDINRTAVRHTRLKPATSEYAQLSSDMEFNLVRIRDNASKAFKLGDYAAALEHYIEAVDSIKKPHPVLAVFLSNRALCYLETGAPRAALTDCERALALIGPNLGRDESFNLGTEVRSLHNSWGSIKLRQAESLEQLERIPEAHEAWNDAVKAGFGGMHALERKRWTQKTVSEHSEKTRKAPASIRSSGKEVVRLRKFLDDAEKVDAEKFAIYDQVHAKVASWSAGKESNIRGLLASLDSILWASVEWKKISLSELLQANRVKVAYMKAISIVHPDKLSSNTTVEQQMIAGKVFSILNEAWDKFKASNE